MNGVLIVIVVLMLMNFIGIITIFALTVEQI